MYKLLFCVGLIPGVLLFSSAKSPAPVAHVQKLSRRPQMVRCTNVQAFLLGKGQMYECALCTEVPSARAAGGSLAKGTNVQTFFFWAAPMACLLAS